MAQASKKNADFMVYRGRPLMRQDKELYYGDMRDPYIIMMRILETRKAGDCDIASKVLVSLMRTAPDTPPQDIIVKSSEKKGIYDALDIGSVWLERALSTGA